MTIPAAQSLSADVDAREHAPERDRNASAPALDSLSQAKRALFAQRLAGRRGEAGRPASRVQPMRDRESVWSHSLSPAEERFWMAYTFEDQSSAYHIPVTFRLTGRLDVSVLNTALQTVVSRHDILRTRYTLLDDGELTAVVEKPRACTFEVVDVDGDVADFLERRTEAPFDLADGPLLRPVLVRQGDDEYILHITVHHIITDGWSIGNLIDELAAAYNAGVRGTAPDLPELVLQYRDHAVWQRSQSELFARQAEYWKQALRGVPRDLGLRTDRPRQSRVTVPGRSVTVTFAKAPAVQLARETRTTLFMVLLAAYSVVLGRHADREDVVVGTPIAGRQDPTTEPLMGCFINTLVMRTDLSGEPTFRELMKRVRRWTLRAYENQDVPFQQVADAAIERTGMRSTLIQAWLALQNMHNPTLDLDGLGSEDVFVTTDATKFDVTYYITELDNDLELEVEYDSSLFDESTMLTFAEEFAGLLEAAASDPDRPLSEVPGAVR
ncbi:condensation domain-containing protein [Streptomyces sp. NPDC048225]|uniref:condensation domain-containing protein n=1 Tax=Streptomyces sp. NPDC048225 TaxID=3365518 RepID=UPI00371240D8